MNWMLCALLCVLESEVTTTGDLGCMVVTALGMVADRLLTILERLVGIEDNFE